MLLVLPNMASVIRVGHGGLLLCIKMHYVCLGVYAEIIKSGTIDLLKR